MEFKNFIAQGGVIFKFLYMVYKAKWNRIYTLYTESKWIRILVTLKGLFPNYEVKCFSRKHNLKNSMHC